MPRTMEVRSLTPRRPAGWPLAFLAACLLLVSAAAPAQSSDEYLLAITANNHPLYPILTDEPPVEDPTGQFEEGVRELREEHPDAFFVEAGEFASFGAVLETAYRSRNLNFVDQMDYSAVHLSARDASLTTIGTSGLHYAPDSIMDRIVTNIHTTNPRPLDLPSHRRTENAAGQAVIFQSLHSMSRAQGLSDRMALLNPEQWEEIRERLTEAAGDHEGPVVASGSLTEEEWEEFFASGTPPIHMYVDTGWTGSTEPELRDGVWRIPAPAMGEVHLVGFRFREAELDGEPTVEKVELLPGIEPEDLIKYPLPRIGVPITNLNNVMRQFFSVTADSVRQDRVDDEGIEDLTAVERPMVYHLEDEEEGTQRLYRIMSIIPHYQRPGLLAVGWPETHAIIVLNDDHELVRFISRIHYPVGGLDTTVLEAIQRLPGTPQEEWAPDPELAAGVEMVWEWVVDDIRRTIELDKRLYGEGGLYYIPPDED